jgi:Amt family ammonium transporter
MSVDSGDTAWVLTSAALVLLMTPALAIFYGGLVGEKMIITTMYMSFISLSIITIQWSLLTYSLSFASSANPGVDPFVGSLEFGAFDSADRVRPGTRIPEHAYFVFQLAFAAVTAAVVSGAVVGRVSYGAWCVFIALWHLLVYTPLARWVFYSGGWLNKFGVLDFAGGLVVEMNSGVSAFVLAAWVSWEVARARPRQQLAAASGAESFLSADEEAGESDGDDFAAAPSAPWSRGAFSREDRAPHNVPFVLLGAGLLFFGWLGFNSGSALASDYLAARAFVNTALAAASGMAGVAVAEAFLKRSGGRWGVPSAVGCATGVVMGLVAITCVFEPRPP